MFEKGESVTCVKGDPEYSLAKGRDYKISATRVLGGQEYVSLEGLNFEFFASRFSPIGPFKVGDHVECIRSRLSPLRCGQVYTVARILSRKMLSLSEMEGTFSHARFKLYDACSCDCGDKCPLGMESRCTADDLRKALIGPFKDVTHKWHVPKGSTVLERTPPISSGESLLHVTEYGGMTWHFPNGQWQSEKTGLADLKPICEVPGA